MASGVLNWTSYLIAAAIVFVAVEARNNRLPTFAGPFIAYGDRFVACPINGHKAPAQLIIRNTRFNPYKPNEKQNISGYINSSTGFDDTWGGTVDLAVRSNNQWKEHAFIMKWPYQACSAFRANVPDLFRILFRSLGDDVFNPNKKCFIPPGTYTFDKEPVAWVFPNFPVMPYGHYRFNLLVTSGGGATPQLCLECEAHAIPKMT